MKTTNPDGVASDPTRDRSVRIVEWPAETEELEALATAGTPRLVLVEEGSEPPLCAECCQDWMWRTDDEGQKRLCLHHLAMRALAQAAELHGWILWVYCTSDCDQCTFLTRSRCSPPSSFGSSTGSCRQNS